MLVGFLVIISIMAAMMLLERLFPDRPLKRVPGWWLRVLLINVFQLGAVLFGLATYERWLQTKTHSPLQLRHYVSPLVGGAIAYLCNTNIFYWWHRIRHESSFFWRTMHQLHHSAQRIEVITSFYKHPLEIVADSLLMAILLYPVLGLDSESSVWLSGFSAVGEYVYHMNIRTPRWMGYFFQRPEMHRVHHARNRKFAGNYSDLPLWDILGGTWNNPDRMEDKTGYSSKNEQRFVDILQFKDVLHPTKRAKWNYDDALHMTIVALGCLSCIGFVIDQPALRGIGFSTAASPLPLVFSAYNGVQTFATTYSIALTANNRTEKIPLTQKIYSKLRGPYNRRNVYGVLFSHAPLFKDNSLIEVRQDLLHYATCSSNSILPELEMFPKPSRLEISSYYGKYLVSSISVDCK